MNKSIFILAFMILLAIPLIPAAAYGTGKYGCGLFGVGCVDAPVSGGDGGSESAGGGGGGGGGAVGRIFRTITGGYLEINPAEPVFSVIEGIEEEREIIITNLRGESFLIDLEIIGDDLKKVLRTDEEISLGPREVKPLKLTIKLENESFILGKIILKNPSFTREIPMVIGSKSENFLFDVSIFLDDEFKKMEAGNRLKAQFNLIQVGIQEEVDVVGTYVIKDFEGNNYYEETETFSVLNEKTYVKEFQTQDLEEGEYVLGFEISYPGAFAVSSVQFSVEDKKRNLAYIIIAVSIAFTIILLYIGIRFSRETRKQTKSLHISLRKKTGANKKI